MAFVGVLYPSRRRGRIGSLAWESGKERIPCTVYIAPGGCTCSTEFTERRKERLANSCSYKYLSKIQSFSVMVNDVRG